jgi:23S rRNA (pseudouridine1915-N3)-methyltransferase
MRLTLAAVGKLKAGPDRDLFERYWDRLEASGRKIGISGARLVELPESRAANAIERKADEAARLLAAARDGSEIIALDETGRAHTSEAFATHIGKRRDGGCAELAFLIGGPDGHGPAVIARAKLVLNLGTLTLPHGLARIVLAEQLYRATTILAGHPYHRS